MHQSDLQLLLEGSEEEEVKQLGFFHPRRRFYAYVVLFFISMISLCGFLIYDSLGVVEVDIEKFGINQQNFGLLYSIYSFPNCVLPFFGGILLDRFGNHKGLIVCCTLVCFGSVLVALAPGLPDMCFVLMMVGRFLFGLGAETSYVAQNKVLVSWFRDKEMALAMSLSVSAGRLGTWLTFSIIPIAVKFYGTWQMSLYIAAMFAFFELICIIVYIILENYAEAQNGKEMDHDEEDSDMNIKDVLLFPVTFWFFAACVCFFYAAMFPFTSTLTSLLQGRYGYSETTAAHYTSMLPLIALFLTPVFGLIVSRVGHRITLTIVGLAIMIGSNAIMFSTWWPPLPAIVGVAVGFALVPAAIWPCMPLIVEEKYIGTAFGLVQSIDNVGMLLSYYSQGLVKYMFHDNAAYALMFFTSLLGVSLVVSVVWFFHDQKKGGICKQVYSRLEEIST